MLEGAIDNPPALPSLGVFAARTADQNPLLSDVDFTQPRPMRVCFPVLLDGDLVVSSEHLGVSYLVSVIRRLGIECLVVEVGPAGEDDERAIAKIRAFRPDVVGLSLTTADVGHATAFGNALRQSLGDGIAFLAGGPLPSALGSKLLANPHWSFLDALVRGEGEISIVRYVEAFWRRDEFLHVPGLSWKSSDGRLIDNPVGPGLVDLEILPIATRDQWEENEGRLPYLRVSTTRGCTASCSFCNAPNAGNRTNEGKLWRSRSCAHVLDEIEWLHRTYKASHFEFVDSTFEDPGGGSLGKRRIHEIAEGILQRGLVIHYSCGMQAKNWQQADAPLLQLLHRSGLEKVLVGIESGSQAGLDIWNKRSTVADNVRVIRLLRDAGIHVEFGFIAYHPWSTFDEIAENNAFLHAFEGHNLRRYAARLEVYPGAAVVPRMRLEGLLHSGFDVSLDPFAYDFQDPRVAVLADFVPRLFDSGPGEIGPVRAFERRSLAFSIAISRFKRREQSEAQAGALAEIEGLAERIRKTLSDFNFDLMSQLTSYAEAGELAETELLAARAEVETLHQAQLDELLKLDAVLSAELRHAAHSTHHWAEVG